MQKVIDFIQKHTNLSFFILALVLVLVMYGSSLAGSFVFDDRSIISYQSFFQNPANWWEVLKMPYWGYEAGLYRPVTIFSYGLNFAIFGSGAWSFHLINILLYVFSGYLLFLFLKKVLWGKYRRQIAWVSALLFLILPIHTEVVANIVGRAEIFALMFSLLGLLELIKKNPNKWITALWFFLAMGSKETAIAVLPIAFLVWFSRSKFLEKKKITLRDLEFYFFPAFLSAFVYLSFRFLILGFYFFSNNASLVENPLKFVSVSERIFTALKILSMYVYKSLVPFNLCSDYSYNQIVVSSSFWESGVIVGFLILVFSFVGIFYFFKKNFNFTLALIFFFFPFFIVSNLWNAIGTIAGERLFFYPSVGLCIFLGIFFVWLWNLAKSENIKKILITLFVLLSFFYTIRSFDRALDWMSEEKLFISASQCAPQSVLSLSNLATVYYFKGDYEQAEKIILDSYEIYDGYTKANNNLGLIYWRGGEIEKAKEQFFKTFEHFPPYEGVYENLVLFYLSQNNEKEAMKWYKIGY
ncbi:MAG: tetratricopeptide repeat protein [Patescibacteria group bacterium]